MADIKIEYESIMIGEVHTYVCKRCGSIAWRCGDHDAWHNFVESTAKNFLEALECLTKILPQEK
jgi:hypothetical protein